MLPSTIDPVCWHNTWLVLLQTYVAATQRPERAYCPITQALLAHLSEALQISRELLADTSVPDDIRNCPFLRDKEAPAEQHSSVPHHLIPSN